MSEKILILFQINHLPVHFHIYQIFNQIVWSDAKSMSRYEYRCTFGSILYSYTIDHRPVLSTIYSVEAFFYYYYIHKAFLHHRVFFILLSRPWSYLCLEAKGGKKVGKKSGKDGKLTLPLSKKEILTNCRCLWAHVWGRGCIALSSECV